MGIFFALLLVGIIPVFFTLLLPKDRDFFNKPIIKGIGLGVYTALIFVLLNESFENGSKITSFGGIFLGLLVSFFIGIYFKEFHHHHEVGVHHVHTKISITKILVSDFFHNIVDGIAIVSGFAINKTIGFTAIIGVLGHQIIQQTGQQILLASEGIKPIKAILISFIVSLSVFFGLLVSKQKSLESMLMALSAGIILFKILTDIRETKWSKKPIIGFVIGFCVLLILLVLIPHGH